MSAVREQDILFRSGGACVVGQWGVPWRRRRVDGREVEAPTFTRADATSCATYFDKDGVLRIAAAGKLRLDYGLSAGLSSLLLEQARANLALWCRDLTNAAWVKTNVTAAKDQTGVDGVASSASKITASAGNGTCLQAITSASATRVTSCYIKRVTGSGTIEMTQDNGATWAPVTVTSAWTRVKIAPASLTNPTVGFRIVTNGDAVAVDFVQQEVGVFPSAPIATTTAAVTRAADAFAHPIAWGPQDFTVYAKVPRPEWADSSTADTVRALCGIAAASGYFLIYGHTGTLRLYAQLNSGSTVEIFQAIPAGTSIEICAQGYDFATAPKCKIDVGSGFSAASSAASAALTAWGASTLNVGRDQTADREWGGGLQRLLICRGLFTLAECQAVGW